MVRIVKIGHSGEMDCSFEDKILWLLLVMAMISVPFKSHMQHSWLLAQSQNLKKRQ